LLQTLIAIVVGLAGAIIIGALWGVVNRKRAAAQLEEARAQAERIVEDARKSADARIKEANVEAKETMLQARAEFDKQSKERREELKGVERRIQQKEEAVDRKGQQLEKRESDLDKRERAAAQREKALDDRENEVNAVIDEQRRRLEQISGLTAEEAKRELIRGIENEAKLEAAQMIKRIETEANELGHLKAKRIIGTAIQRLASDYVAENTSRSSTCRRKT
jgi:Domain of unknown function (DUF3552).